VARRKIQPDLKEVERLASIGLNEQQVADSLGINIGTLQKRKDDNAGFLAALKRGKAKGVQAVSNALFDQATELNNTSAAIFFMKNRAGWTDKAESTVKVTMTETDADQVLRDAGIDPDSI